MNTDASFNQPSPIRDENLDVITGGITPARKEISFCDLAEMTDSPRAKKFFASYTFEKQMT